ncbi:MULTISPECIES: complex I subunit 5 family protein [unclassified Marinobacter]|uniref:complex I subunit 5 family protein n=1 Tax=unclassified Marinobacter TaxID=83889 RepID=UPI0012678EF9|nr:MULTISPECIES: proton-conducting transporter membrane subunit [unclassified Marinobacter]QFS88213.1 Na(+)/H(+) antiporter subunit D [Marinobacter sp. THAF197a]QFT51998.1 Na(+)/H(+) antiporter subunit D [Marinobacter sp. THAF39]
MNLSVLMPVFALMTSLVASVVLFALPERGFRLRTTINLVAAILKIALVGMMIWGVAQGREYEAAFTMVPGVEFVLRADALSMLFAGLSALLWLLTTIYAVGYLEDSPNRSRFFGFFSLCVASTMGIALAGNLFTFFLFYEMLTLSTYPLVVHRGTTKALRAGRNYIIYTLTGGAVLLFAIAWLHGLVGDLRFQEGGYFSDIAPSMQGPLTIIFVLMIVGLGVKAALVPFHGWLPQAMVAPAPVSALLHAVAVVKAGAFGIIRVVFEIYGLEAAKDMGLLAGLSVVAAFTIIYGSTRALYQVDLKRRLAFSTVSQVSYIVLGLCLFGPVGVAGGLVHLVHQGIMKITLFFCAGNYAETLGVHRIDELDGAGKRMPGTSVAFTLGAFGMIGAPPLAGFITKWTMGSGALAVGMDWVVAVLVISSLLNAAYFLPILHRLWFAEQCEPWPHERRWGRLETSAWLLWPPLITAALMLVAGLIANLPFSPLSWAELIVAREVAL